MVTNLEVDSHNRFKYCFMALGASIRDWKHCRPIIVVDGTYLNGHYEENLKKAYENREGLFFVLDRYNSIKNAIEYMYPRTYHGICSYHLLQNLKSHFGKSGQNITQAFNSAVRACTLEEFEYHMRQLDTINQKISAYLAEVGPEKWSRIHMPENRYSTMTSNIVELVNTFTKTAKNYPIVSPLKSLRQTTQNWFCKHRDNAHGTFTKLTSKYENEIRKMSIDLKNLRFFLPTSLFSVSNDKTTFVVNIEKQTCTCRMLQVDLLPYSHALTVIATTKRDSCTFCSYYYTRDAYLKAYEDSIYPVGNPSEWTLPKEVLHEIILASNQKWSCGRPNEKRKRSSRK
ncbi:uncharacterized protein LOC111367008 [Olea europaea var. sylvestris]|uniref:uncharacterized protein LOC111367008 n=1 Tax=Olea europaea var. sylvestris TaxID=158386 RepID=UPI000C1D2F8C|nr:uncharacterized protein LOC111367008 [Olea europaea var. sylvestris]